MFKSPSAAAIKTTNNNTVINLGLMAGYFGDIMKLELKKQLKI
jgi:hypothetical protein